MVITTRYAVGLNFNVCLWKIKGKKVSKIARCFSSFSTLTRPFSFSYVKTSVVRNFLFEHQVIICRQQIANSFVFVHVWSFVCLFLLFDDVLFFFGQRYVASRFKIFFLMSDSVKHTWKENNSKENKRKKKPFCWSEIIGIYHYKRVL